MPVPVVELAKYLSARLTALRGETFARVYRPEMDKSKLVDGKWFVAASEDDTKTARGHDETKLQCDLVYQRSLPDPTNACPIPADNLEFLDACMEAVEAVKALFRDGGVLREQDDDRFTLLEMKNDPVYFADYLYEAGIFISGVRLTYFHNSDPDD